MLTSSKAQPGKSDLLDIEREASEELLLQSSDAESSTDDVTSSTRTSSHKFSPDSSSVWKSVVNIVNFIEGLGFLALPFALKEGGIVVMVGFFIIPICLWYTGKVLIECFYDTDEKQRRVRARSTFKELGEVLSLRCGGYVVTAFVQLDLYLAPVSYLILCGSLMSHALPSVPLSVIAWTCIAGVAVFPTTFLKSLSDIAWLSVVSVVALISVLISVFWYGAKHMNEWDLDTILFWDSEGVSIGLSILMYGYGALPILPSVEESMREKHRFTLALALAYAITMVIKIVFSVFAFLSFGSDTNQVILNNLPEGPLRMSISFIFVIFCVLSYVLPLYPVFDFLQTFTAIEIVSARMPILGPLLIRIIVVLSTILIAILVPKFALVVSFAGSVFASFFTFIFPCAVHLKLKFRKLKRYEVCLDILLIFIGTVAFIFGVIYSGRALIMG